MKYAPYSSTRRTAPAALLMLAALSGVHAAAQDLQDTPSSTASQAGKPAADTTAAGEQSPIKINAKKNPGDLSYKSFYGMQALIQSFQPPEPRVIDFSYRVSFMDLSLAERDAYAPESWAVAIVGDSFDQVVPVARGGYFVLPESPQAVQENATVMFNAQTRWRSLNVAFKLRVSPQQTLTYAQFARAIDEFKTVQGQVPWYRPGLRAIRSARIDGLRACFRSTGARIEIDGVTAATRLEGMCQVLRFEPARAATPQASISFVGVLENVMLNEKDD